MKGNKNPPLRPSAVRYQSFYTIEIMIRILLLTTLLTTFYSCKQTQEIKHHKYSNQVGEIAFVEKIDDPAFKVADTLAIFAKPRYIGEKPAIVNHFKEEYKSVGFAKVNGYIIIRLYVNNEGKAGLFRVQAMDFEYQPIEFDEKLCDKILQLTKELNGWKAIQYEGKSYGYYCYLSFKIVNAEITAIMP